MSAAWQPLPEALPPEVRHFVEQLRLLKDRTGLSLIELGRETAYSKSSWQRYLNAQQPPPRQAVAALCKVAGEDGERFCARWEVAVRVWPRGGAGSARPAPGVVLSKAGRDVPPVRPRRPRRPRRTQRPSRARSAWTWRSTAGVTALLVLMVLLEGLLRYLMR
ncbi:helix-turn-helix domain-containing protein [Streptomyces sp. NBC_01283]|uniref:helix-turn-helix domain-containing protein n=1 Tax=Streptomyces sp. NBC_01283 TaxID=2903812 RepID=UPI00352CF1CC|nr:helix-turn-helix domain-containing protein [Streptomyces sp. NBC_01283]